MASVGQNITWPTLQIHFQWIGHRFMLRLSVPYSADGGGGAAGSVITENCCVGKKIRNKNGVRTLM